MMKRLTGSVMMSLTLVVLAGCGEPARYPAEDPGPYFCDVEEPRSFSKHVWEWRKVHDRDELVKDLKTNETGARRCGWG